MKRVTTSRWSCRADATKALKHCYLQVKNGEEKICNDAEEKARVRCDAEGLLARLNQLETGRHFLIRAILFSVQLATKRILSCLVENKDVGNLACSLSRIDTNCHST